MKEIQIKGTLIGSGHPGYVIAEIGTNHDQSLEVAKEMIEAISKTGCDCVKFQIYEPNEIVSKLIRASDYELDDIYGDISAQEMFDKHLKTPKSWFPELKQLCHRLGMACGVTVHGEHGIAWAKEIGFDMVKVASMDHTNIPFLAKLVNQIKAPILASFGMAELDGIEAAIKVLDKHKYGVGIFHCCAIYPPKKDEVRLKNIPFLINKTNLVVGFSDHTIGLETAKEAQALGAVIYEKHVTLSRKNPGPDHPFAMEMEELAEYVTSLKEMQANELDLSSYKFSPLSSREAAKRPLYLKSIIAQRDLAIGHILTEEDVYLARPGSGLMPKYLPKIIGSALTRVVKADTPLQHEDVEIE